MSKTFVWERLKNHLPALVKTKIDRSTPESKLKEEEMAAAWTSDELVYPHSIISQCLAVHYGCFMI